MQGLGSDLAERYVQGLGSDPSVNYVRVWEMISLPDTYKKSSPCKIRMGLGVVLQCHSALTVHSTASKVPPWQCEIFTCLRRPV